MEELNKKIAAHMERIEELQFEIDMNKDFIWYHKTQIEKYRKELEDG